MLPSEKNKKTIGIISQLKRQGVPKQMIVDEEEEEEEFEELDPDSLLEQLMGKQGL